MDTPLSVPPQPVRPRRCRTALVEHADGRLELLHWSERRETLTVARPSQSPVRQRAA